MPDLEYDLLLDEDGNLLYSGQIDVRTNAPYGHGEAYQDGILLYEGDFVAGDWEGIGKEYYGNGSIRYEGGWLDSYYHGYGIYYSETGKVEYQGKFIKGEWIPEESALVTEQDERVKQLSQDHKKSLEKLLADLNLLIGLDEVKEEVKSLVNLIKVQKMRSERGLSSIKLSLHLVLTGNPGTGKTTVARLLGEIYGSLGVISKGQFIEADRSTLVAGYTGQTAIQVAEVVESAIGGVLFIDEAYSLDQDEHDNFGSEAISTLLKLMEDHRDDLVVIIAGYDEPIKELLVSNPGLESRFNRFINFEDYSAAELLKITNKLCEDNCYKLSTKSKGMLLKIFTILIKKKDDDFANARLARNLFEKIVVHQANRISQTNSPSDDDLITIELGDIKQVLLNKEISI